ncbi:MULTISPECIES: hydroxyisourate hydrolase [Streptomyces]|uniref:5-hydroxyisourate hydrolase n=1 Tax=Streptomyces solicathayae TaxID=3081768 RepID=A0ABZ0M4C3_9ACTN|nr:hydroxyisourate hydrolase [Streptomyces sp. HUAS YS2]WOX26432.1 hydroxyisourate hydrolase [Streptomyces sp. HUAS YS2]
MAGISTHVLDIANGKPGAGMRIDFSILDDGAYRLVKTVRTNEEGRTDEPIVRPENATAGRYELLFHVDEYYAGLRRKLPDPPFVDQVPVRFTVVDAKQHFHVPLICTPWNCTMYRGS